MRIKEKTEVNNENKILKIKIKNEYYHTFSSIIDRVDRNIF